MHHTAEDQEIWPLLLQRVDAAGDTQGRATLEAMEAEHAEIDPLLAACGDGFAQLAGAAIDEGSADSGADNANDTRAALEIRLVVTRERLDRHLGHEERDAIALTQRYFTAGDWHAIDGRIQQSYTLTESLAVLPWVRHELPAGARDRLMTMPGATAMSAVWRVLLRPVFNHRQRRTFRYLRG